MLMQFSVRQDASTTEPTATVALESPGAIDLQTLNPIADRFKSPQGTCCIQILAARGPHPNQGLAGHASDSMVATATLHSLGEVILSCPQRETRKKGTKADLEVMSWMVRLATTRMLVILRERSGATNLGDDDPVNPRPDTLRHVVLQDQPLWIVFQSGMVITLEQELITNSFKIISACITIQSITNIIIHGDVAHSR